jgi:two-component system, sensor histidine kinase RegB
MLRTAQGMVCGAADPMPTCDKSSQPEALQSHVSGSARTMASMKTFPWSGRDDPSGAGSLRRLCLLRWISIAGQLVFATVSALVFGVGPSPWWIGAVCGLEALFNLASWRRAAGQPQIGDLELFLQLLFDAGALTLVVWLAGGETNPLITLYLPLVAIGAAILPARLAALLTAVSIAAYTALSFSHGTAAIHDHARAFRLHLIGMWLIFVLAAVIIAWFVVRMTTAIRSRDAQLALAREAALRNERIVALGNLAAGAAHELGTPLATLSVLAGELVAYPGVPSEMQDDLALMQQQIQECKRIITQLAVRAGSSRAESGQPSSVDRWIEQLTRRWQAQRPIVRPRIDLQGASPGPRIVPDATLEQALLNLFNNAADASPADVDIRASWDADRLRVDVLDRGPGIPDDLVARLGHDAVTTRDDGHGLGLMLAFSAIERSGGSLDFHPRDGGGTQAEVRLPIERLRAA